MKESSHSHNPEVVGFLDWVQQQGYNTLSVASFLMNRRKEGRGLGWETPRLWPLDAREFARAEAILDELLEREILVYPFGGFLGRDSECPRDPADQAVFIRYVLARWGWYPHLLHNVSGPEPNLAGRVWLDSSEVERVGRLIRRRDHYNRPLSVHNQAGDDPYRDSDWSTFVTLQGPKTVDRARLGEDLRRNLHPSKPLLAQETLWSGNQYHHEAVGREYSDDDIRRNALTILFSGGQFCFADNQGDSSSGFSGTMDLNERQQHRHDLVRRVWDWLETMPFFEMRPEPDLAGGLPCLAWPGRRVLVFCESGRAPQLSPELLRGTVTWIDATTFQTVGRPTAVTADSPMCPPDDGDWILDLCLQGHGLAEQVHLSSRGCPSREMTVTWITSGRQDPPRVELRRPDGQVETRDGSSEKSPGSGWIHQVDLENLQPSAEYAYSVSHDDGRPEVWSEPTRFSTCPDRLQEGIRIGFFCDTGLIGRLDGNVTGAKAVQDALLADRPNLLLGAGDWAYANRDGRFARTADAIDEWFRQWQPLLSRAAMFTQFGNHETVLGESYEDWAPRLAQPEGFDQGRCFSFDVADVHICALFAANERTFIQQASAPDSPLLGWLRDDLKAARQGRPRWIIVFQHLPVFGHGTSHPAHQAVRELLCPILEQYDVDLHLSGHDQNYERTYPMTWRGGGGHVEQSDRALYRQGAGVIYAKVSPAGKRSEIGDQFSRLPASLPEYMAASHTGAHHYALLSIAPDTLTMTTRGLLHSQEDPVEIDRFVIQGG